MKFCVTCNLQTVFYVPLVRIGKNVPHANSSQKVLRPLTLEDFRGVIYEILCHL